MVCDRSIAMCVDCVTTADCPENNDCTARRCVPFVPCANSLECPTNQVCNASAGRCVGCVTEADCADTTMTCVANVCRTKCASDRTCTPLGLLCDLSSGSCVPCIAPADCPTGQYCQANSCVTAICVPNQTACMLNAVATCDSMGGGFVGSAVPCDPRICMASASGARCVDPTVDGGAGGTTGTGGSGSAGTTGAGGATAGTTGAGGTGGAAGTTGAGGGGTAGTTGAGNTSGAAGTTGAGNTIGTGGTGGTGGSAGTTGAAGTSGNTCGAAFAVSSGGFVTAPAVAGACWHGYAFTGSDSGSALSPLNFSTCGTPCMLRISGTVGPATLANNYLGYAYLGINLGQDISTTGTPTITPAGSSLTVTFAASTGSLPLRAQLTAGSTQYCYAITAASPITIPYTAFKTECWATTGTAYAKQPIQNFQLVVPGGATATSVSVTILSIMEN